MHLFTFTLLAVALPLTAAAAIDTESNDLIVDLGYARFKGIANTTAG